MGPKGIKKCPKDKGGCGNILEACNRGVYYCDNEECKVHGVRFDVHGVARVISWSGLQYPTEHRIQRKAYVENWSKVK